MRRSSSMAIPFACAVLWLTAAGCGLATDPLDAPSCTDKQSCPAGEDVRTPPSGGGPTQATSTYPVGPYGITQGATLESFQVTEARCNGAASAGSDDLSLQDLLGAKALLIVVSSGLCSECKTLTASLEAAYQATYGARGLSILYISIQDDLGQSGSQALLAYCCKTAELFGLSGVVVAADPAATRTGKLFPSSGVSVPLTLVLDANMKILFQQAGSVPDPAAVKRAIESQL